MSTHRIPVEERFWDKVDIRSEDECWPWLAYTFPNGYGGIKVDGKTVGAHVVAYRLTYGDVPEGEEVCHSCDNPPCCNPKHLFSGTHLENMQDKVKKGRGNHINKRAGAAHPKAKITEEIADAIRAEYAMGGHTHRSLAQKHGLHHSTIGQILGRVSWNR